MTTPRSLLGPLALAGVAVFAVACSEKAPTSPANSPVSFLSASTVGQADTGEVELCKYGTSADFTYTVDGGAVQNVSLADGGCAVLATSIALGTGTHSVSITETSDPATVLDSIVATTVSVLNHTPQRGAPITGTATFSTNFNGDHGTLVEYYNHPAPPPPPPSNGCTLTQGYWKNHTSAWPAPYSPSATFYTSGQTWLGVLNTPAKGNAYYILGYQFIAATLNSANGASVPSNVQSALDDADTYFTDPSSSSLSRSDLITLAGTLDDYNNGLLGVPHCP